jgi:hypothetical protein
MASRQRSPCSEAGDRPAVVDYFDHLLRLQDSWVFSADNTSGRTMSPLLTLKRQLPSCASPNDGWNIGWPLILSTPLVFPSTSPWEGGRNLSRRTQTGYARSYAT